MITSPGKADRALPNPIAEVMRDDPGMTEEEAKEALELAGGL